MPAEECYSRQARSQVHLNLLAFSETERLRPDTWVTWTTCCRLNVPHHPRFATARNNTPSCRLLLVHYSADHPRLVTRRLGPDTQPISCTNTHNHILRTVLNFEQVQLWLCPTALLTAIKHDSRPIAFKQEIK